MGNSFLIMIYVVLLSITIMFTEVLASSHIASTSIWTQIGKASEGEISSITYTVTIIADIPSSGISYVSLSGTELPTGAYASFSDGTFGIIGN